MTNEMTHFLRRRAAQRPRDWVDEVGEREPGEVEEDGGQDMAFAGDGAGFTGKGARSAGDHQGEKDDADEEVRGEENVPAARITFGGVGRLVGRVVRHRRLAKRRRAGAWAARTRCAQGNR